MMAPAPPSTPPPVQQPPPQPPPPPNTTPTPPSQPAPENPAADFTPNPGQQGDTFTLVVSGFRPGANVDVTLTRPDGVVEHYPISIGQDGSGRYVFTHTDSVVTGTYSATVTNPATGASAHTSLQVSPKGGP
jgi:hypothetical protein